MNGSALIAVADTRDDVLALLRADVYATEGVWDVDRVSFYSPPPPPPPAPLWTKCSGRGMCVLNWNGGGWVSGDV